MHSSAWVELVRLIPPDQHGDLVLMTTIGQEFSLRAIVRVENDYLVIRGRLAGTTDIGRVFFIPYDQINYLGYQSEVREAQIRALYGEFGPAAALQEPSAEKLTNATAESAAASSPPASQDPSLLMVPPSGKSSGRIPIPSKKALLERLRQRNRSTDNGPSSPAP